ncbi:MAG: peptide chain release factor N(5)-glutamine methyltransferase [Micrococcales bacterium]|nr:peptide chain release factor N(5)-glutamine methyltransferase [Micrococcales bacterium]
MSEPALAELLRRGVDLLSRARVPSPQADAELLLGHVLGFSRGELQAKALVGAQASSERARAFLDAVERRAAREPLQHITGVAAFRHLQLRVGPGVFVPRPETETVAQLAIDALLAVPSPAPVAIDLGTGSGAIALALATEVAHARVIAVENSARAFVWARENAAAVGVSNLRLVFDDLAHCLPDLEGAADVVVSNPPYIPDDAVPRDPEVRLHDPAAALYGGPDGLDVVRALSHRALTFLRPGGALILEHGEQQGRALRTLLAADGWRDPVTHKDLTRRDRATTATRP